ncbi:MAG: hypothetical protein ACHQO8_04975 [Vicinamibacterales bacterium]
MTIVPRLGRARLVLTVGILGVALAGRLIDFPRLAGKIKGDEATYVGMALSLAHDGDLKYTPEDLARFRQLYPDGPEGIFLKRSYRWGVGEKTPVPVTESLSFAKALAYPIAAAPFVALGGLGGMLVLNGLLLLGCVWCAVRFCQARVGRIAGAVLGVAFVVASVVPVFTVWLTSEIFNFALVLFAYFLWLYKQAAPPEARGRWGGAWTDIAAAILLGVATYSKPGVLIAPLVLAGFFQWSRRHWLAVVAAFVIATSALFGLNTLVTGEWNYQGGDRKSFYDRYPFSDATAKFDEMGSDMTTNDADTGMVFAPETLRLLPQNAWYFLAGRDAGLVPFYFPGVLITILWLIRWRRSTLWQWATALACAGSVGVLLIYFPFTWNGAGGPPGNRYFLAVYPTMLFLLPSGVGLIGAVSAAMVGAAFTGAMVVRPFAASSDTWLNVGRAPLRWLPIELTIMDDLPVRLNGKRGRIILVQDPTVFAYLMDKNTYDAEGQGYWIAGDASTDIVLRIDRPLTRLELDLSTRVPNTVTISFAGRSQRVDLPADGVTRVRIAPRDQIDVHNSFPYILHVSTTAGFVPATTDPGSRDTRNLGVFIKLSFMYGPQGEPLAPAPPAKSGGG